MKPVTKTPIPTHKSLFRAGVIVFLTIAVLVGSRRYLSDSPTGGAVLTFTSTIPDKRIDISSALDESGRPFSHVGSFGQSDNPMNGGATMGSTPGTFGLPIWVEFTWKELPYPSQPRESFATYEAWGKYVDDEYQAALMKTERVNVAEKVPASALEEVAKSAAATPSGKLPDKMLWLYFIWTADGIKVRWRVYNSARGGNSAEGGDPL